MRITPRPIYLDNHATTAVDPRVVEAMVPYFLESYGNAGSTTHELGLAAREAVESARTSIAGRLGVTGDELIFTSGATESNNLALRGLVERRLSQQLPVHVVSVVTEHRAVLDPLRRLERLGVSVTWLPVADYARPDCGRLDLDQLQAALRPDTQVVSVMLANNEIGVVQPLAEIAAICHERGIVVHCDATQGVGKLPIDVIASSIDLLSCSAHKLHGPKGVGALVIRRQSPRLRLAPLIEGGGQERGLRSGTLPVPLIVGFARAMELADDDRIAGGSDRMAAARDRFWLALQTQIPGLHLNGPTFDGTSDGPKWRLPNNLNLRLDGIEGATWMLATPEVAMSSGSACTAATPTPSHVLSAIGLSDDQVRSSVRMGLSRMTTDDDLVAAVEYLAQGARRLRG